MRNIIQITAAAGGNGATVVALCDDGSIWEKLPEENKWRRLIDVPGTKNSNLVPSGSSQGDRTENRGRYVYHKDR